MSEIPGQSGRAPLTAALCHNRMYQLSALPPDPHPRIAIAGFTRKSYSLGSPAAVTLAALVHPDRRARRDPATFHQAAWSR